MKRLTERINGIAVLAKDQFRKYTDPLKAIEKLSGRLADYEDTGLEPEQIYQIARASERMMFENVGDFVRYSIANFEQLEEYRKLKHDGQIHFLPCKIGDTCWAVKRTQGGKRIFQTVVSEMYFDFHMNLIVVGRRVCRGHIGKDIFLSFQEAHEYLVNENRKEEK